MALVLQDQGRDQLADTDAMADDGNMDILLALPRGLPHMRHHEFVDGLFGPLLDVVQAFTVWELLMAFMHYWPQAPGEVLLVGKTGRNFVSPRLAFRVAPVLLP